FRVRASARPSWNTRSITSSTAVSSISSRIRPGNRRQPPNTLRDFLRASDERRRTKQRVVRIDLVDVFGRNHLVVYEDGRRNGPSRQDVEREPDEIVAVTLGEVGDRGDQRSPRIAKFSARVRFGVLPGNRAVRVAAGPLEGAARGGA